MLLCLWACAQSADGTPLGADASDGSVVDTGIVDTSVDTGAEPVCGDGICNGEESCDTCDDCLDTCPPDPCGSRVCGPDGMGGSCGTCDPTNDDPCLRNLCGEEGQCAMTVPLDGTGCDDGDPCTIGESCLAGVCQGGVDQGGCGGPLENCLLWGKAGEVIECPLRLASKTQETPRAAALAHRLLYDATLVELQRLACPMDLPTGIPITIDPCDDPTSPKLPVSEAGGGHAIMTNPQNRADWAGNVKIVIFLASAPKLLNDAYLAPDGKVIGDPNIYRMVFQLVADIPEASATTLELIELDLSDVNAYMLKGTVEGTLVIVEAP